MRKKQRALSITNPMHLVLKCRKKIYGQRLVVEEVLMSSAKKFGVPVFDYAVAEDHVHFVTKVPSREAYVRFIRAFTGRLARLYGKGLISSLFTRIAGWGADYWNLIVYCRKNREEAIRGDGFRYYRPKPRYRRSPD